jgi:hypothetical protein
MLFGKAISAKTVKTGLLPLRLTCPEGEKITLKV